VKLLQELIHLVEQSSLLPRSTAFEDVRREQGKESARMENLVGLTEAEVRALPQVTISEIMLATCNPWTFDPVLGTLDALIGSGKLGVLRHAPLPESLTTFGNPVADAAGDVEFLNSSRLRASTELDTIPDVSRLSYRWRQGVLSRHV
jgi:hypothetical protein